MTKPKDRRKFLKMGTITAAVGLAGKTAAQERNPDLALPHNPNAPSSLGDASAEPATPVGSDAQAVMESDEPVEKGAVLAEIVRRFGDPDRYEPAPKMMGMEHINQ